MDVNEQQELPIIKDEIQLTNSDTSEGSLRERDDDSPNLKKQIRSLKVENRRLDINKKKERWKLCGCDVNRHFLKYLIQILFIFYVITFSIIQIIRDVDQPEIYFSLISSMIGWVLPSPTMEED